MPTQYDISLWSGNTDTREFTLKDSLGAVVDLTGATVRFIAALSKKDPIVDKNLTVSAPLTGKATLSLTKAETEKFEDRSSGYEIVLIQGGVETTLLYGTITALGGLNNV